MTSEADTAIIQFLDGHSGKALQKDILASLRARWNEGHIYSRLRTLVSRGAIERTRDPSGHLVVRSLQVQEAEDTV